VSESQTTADGAPSPSVIRRVEEVCDDFEMALKAGSSPKPRNYLERVAVHDRPKLLIELEALVEDYRPRMDDASTLSELSHPTPPLEPEENGKTRLPERVGKYKILGWLGEGAMGVVYRAHHPVLNQDVALKTIRPQNSLNSGETERILAEARKVAKLKHPNVVAIHDADEDDGWPYFTMALVEGGTIHSQRVEFQFGAPIKNKHGKPDSLTTLGWSRKRLKARKEKILTLMEKVCRAVHAAHTNLPTIIHRDLKPSNILLDGDEPRVSDFGLAKMVVVDDDVPIPDDGYSGTPPYMSPEQHRGETKNILATSDVWAIGVILYELFTGRRPFLGKTRREIKLAVLNTEPPRPRELNKRIDLDLEAIILKCLEKDVARRYETAAALADDLVRNRNGEPIPVRPVGRPERLWRWAVHKPALAGLNGLATLTVAAAIVLFITFMFFRSHLSRQEKIKAATDALDKGIALCEQGDAAQGILWMARSFEMAPADERELCLRIQERLSESYRQISPLKAIIDEQSRVLAVAFSPDGRTFLTGNAQGMAQLRDTDTGQAVCEPFRHPAQVLAVAFSPDGKTILTGCFDEYARLWSPSQAERAAQHLPHRDTVFAVSFSPDGKTLFSGGGDGTVQLWEAFSGKQVGKLRCVEDQVHSLAISSDGKIIVAGTGSSFGTFGRARLWDADTLKPVGEPLLHLGAVWAVAFSPDDKTIVTGSEKEALQWELPRPEGPRLARCRHGVPVRSVVFSRDGKTILTGSNDKTARLWDAASGVSLGAPLHHAATVRSVAFSPDPNSTLILTGSEDKSARLWKRPALLEGPTKELVLWTQVLTGMELDEKGEARPLNAVEWQERRQRLDELGEAPPP
jgi:eukaryotic-like serine/threonine-protein kinase